MTHTFGLPLSVGEAVSVAAIGVSTAGLALLFGRRLFTPPQDLPQVGETASQVDMALPGSGQERRNAPRRRGNCVAAHLSDDSDSTPAEVWVVDRSLGGLCLLAEAPVEVGSRLRVRPRHASGSQIWTPVRVRSCQRDREGWLLHCQFLQIPPMNVLLLYG
jgi:PilZ domain